MLKEFDTIARLETEATNAYTMHSTIEGCYHINGSPQNTLVLGIADFDEKHNVFMAGDLFKPGQTKTKSALVLFFAGAGMKTSLYRLVLPPWQQRRSQLY